MAAPDGASLPGGMSVRQARKYVQGTRSPWTAVVIAIGLAAAAVGATTGGDVLMAVIFALSSATVVFFAIQRTGVRITERSQPALWRMVDQTARRAGAPPPHAVWLTHRPEV